MSTPAFPHSPRNPIRLDKPLPVLREQDTYASDPIPTRRSVIEEECENGALYQNLQSHGETAYKVAKARHSVGSRRSLPSRRSLSARPAPIIDGRFHNSSRPLSMIDRWSQRISRTVEEDITALPTVHPSSSKTTSLSGWRLNTLNLA